MARILADLALFPATGITMSPAIQSSNALWDFSLEQYRKPGVSELCLQLQDRYGANVNLVFWVLWLGVYGHRLDAPLLALGQARIEVWDKDYVLPLRQLRRQMKQQFGSDNASIEQVRGLIKKAELMAEKQVQLILEDMAADHCSASPTIPANMPVRDNLYVYLDSLPASRNLADQLLVLLKLETESNV